MKKRYIFLILILAVGCFTITAIKIKGLSVKNVTLSTVRECVGSIKNFSKKLFSKDLDVSSIIIIKPDPKIFEIYSLLPDQNILITKFLKKEWGTWNIDAWSIDNDHSIPSKSPNLMAGGGSDWEYVFKVSEKPRESYIFSGGNHGREVLKAIDFYNAKTNRKLNLNKLNRIIKLKRLKIVEKTALTFDEEQKREYADVTRTYIVSPSKIELQTDFTFKANLYMGTTYVCMLPILKEYGRHIRYTESGNIYTTPPSGETLTTDTFENFLGKEKSKSVELWGDANPNYRFRVSITSDKMVDYFQNSMKVSYWDCNVFGNKLYFSKYDDSDHKNITPGTIWHNAQTWEIREVESISAIPAKE